MWRVLVALAAPALASVDGSGPYKLGSDGDVPTALPNDQCVNMPDGEIDINFSTDNGAAIRVDNLEGRQSPSGERHNGACNRKTYSRASASMDAE